MSGLTSKLPARVAITGGLAGDGPRFGETLVCLDGPAEPGVVAAVGFYGRHIQIGYGSVGGWEAFGPERTITRSEGNVLYEIDGRSALALYKDHLGEHAAGLPASGLLFPLNVRRNTHEIGVVRTILGTSEERQSITFAGDVPQGRHTRLMRSSFDRMIAAAAQAAYASRATLSTTAPDLAILISCIGRKLLLEQRIAEEVESVRAVFGDKAALAGFYSYGEISPFGPSGECELHNQTLTITTFSEQLDRASLAR